MRKNKMDRASLVEHIVTLSGLTRRRGSTEYLTRSQLVELALYLEKTKQKEEPNGTAEKTVK